MLREILGWCAWGAQGLSVGLGAIAHAPTREEFEREREMRLDAEAALAELRSERDAAVSELSKRLNECCDLEIALDKARLDATRAEDTLAVISADVGIPPVENVATWRLAIIDRCKTLAALGGVRRVAS